MTKTHGLGLAFAIACCVVATSAIGQGKYRPEDLASWVGQWSMPQSLDVGMRISWRIKDKHEYLHCRLTNNADHPVVVNGAVLPWKFFIAIAIIPFNGGGKAVYVDTTPVNYPEPPPEPLMLGAGTSVEGDIDFEKVPYYKATAREDLFLLWRARVPVRTHPTMAGGRDILLPPDFDLSGIAFVPKHALHQSE